jgi:D-apiose dehydrogenase
MRDRIRIALVGCGFYAQNHLNAWRDLGPQGADLVGVCDLDPVKSANAGAQFSAPHFTDVATMIDAVAPDCLDIVTRMNAHRAVAGLAADRGIGAIIQKPLAPDWAEAVAIVEKAQSCGTFLAVHENFRFQAPMLAVKEILASGEIGDVSWARLAFRTGFDVYKTQPYFLTEPRLAILDVGIHVLDLARVFLGEVAHLSCETQQRKPSIIGEDTATMLLRHISGAVSIVECTYEDRRLPDHFPETLIEIEGTRGGIAIAGGLKMTVTANGATRDVDVSVPLLPWTSRPWHVSQESVLRTNEHLLMALKTGTTPDVSGADNLATFALVEAAYAAATRHTTVKPLQWSGSRAGPRSGS